MAINKVVAPNSVPTNVSDYVAQNAHMMGFMTQVNMQAFVLTDPTTADKPKVALGSYIAHGGSLYKVEGGDETISGSPADGKVYVRVTGNATLSASFVSDISGYSYNHAYGTMTSGAYTLLPYVVIKVGTSWLKYRYDAVQKLQAETLNTGQGDNLLYPMNQAVRTIDNPVFGWRTADDIITLKDVRLRYPSLGAGGESAVYGQSQFDTTMTTSTSYVKRASFKISDVLNRVAPQNGITGARIRFGVSNPQAGSAGQGGCKIVVGGVVKYEDTYNISYIAVAHDVSLTSEDIIEVWIRFISGGTGTLISSTAVTGVSFSRALTPIEALFVPMGV